MAMNPDSTTPQLACGNDPAQVWDHAAAGHPSDHETSCPHCQNTIADQASLSATLRQLTDEDIEPPPNLLEQIMQVVRSELRRTYLPLPTQNGSARLDHGAAAAVLRRVVDRMPEIRARSCRISSTGAHHDETSTATGDELRVRLSISAQMGTDLPSAAARARQMILAATQDLLGLDVHIVDIDIVDIFIDTPADTPDGDHR